MQLLQSLQLPQDLQKCIQLCQECHISCEALMMYCLQLGGSHAEVSHQRALRDCAQICQTCVDFMLRQSPLASHVCGACAQACLQCAESCERIGAGDTQMMACADLCRRCAQSCQHMAHMPV